MPEIKFKDKEVRETLCLIVGILSIDLQKVCFWTCTSSNLSLSNFLWLCFLLQVENRLCAACSQKSAYLPAIGLYRFYQWNWSLPKEILTYSEKYKLIHGFFSTWINDRNCCISIDITKSFDIFWHVGLLKKMPSSCRSVNVGVIKGSVNHRHFFFIHSSQADDSILNSYLESL